MFEDRSSQSTKFFQLYFPSYRLFKETTLSVPAVWGAGAHIRHLARSLENAVRGRKGNHVRVPCAKFGGRRTVRGSAASS